MPAPVDTAGPVRIDLAGLTDLCDPGERWLLHALRADDVLANASREDWRALCEAAVRTYTGPLLHARLSARGLLDLAPDEVAVRLARLRAWSAARWEHARRQLARLGEALAAEGLACIALKGAHLAHLYDQPGARAMGDLDLHVPADQADEVLRVLERLGYRARSPERWKEVHPGHRHLPPLYVDGGLPVELHTTLAVEAGGPWDPTALERARPLLPGVRALDPLDALLYTCQHLAWHHFFEAPNGLAGLADMAVLVPEIDATALKVRAEDWGLRPAAALCLLLARDLLAAPVTDEQLDAVPIPDLLPAARSAVWVLFHVGTLGMTRHLQLRTRSTLNPPPPILAVRGARPLRAAWHWTRSAALPPLDDLRLDDPLPLAWPRLWGRLAWRHAGLLRLLSRRERAAARALRQAHHQRILAALDVG